MKLVLISNPSNISGEFSLLKKLFKNGLEILHLRKPELGINEFENFINEIPEQFHDRIVIHSHFDLIKKYKFKGLHFNQHTKHLFDEFREIDVHKSFSCHRIEEIPYNKNFNYLFLSPIFNSISKKGYNSNFNFEELHQFLKEKQKFKVIALGGIEKDNILIVKEMKFFGAALHGSMWLPLINGLHEDKIVKNFKEINYLCHL